MNNPFFYEPDALCLMAVEQVKELIAEHETWRDEVAQGKMFGVLVVERATAHGIQLGYLAAFSGQLGGKATWEGFVPPVFDYLQPDGYFKTHLVISFSCTTMSNSRCPFFFGYFY